MAIRAVGSPSDGHTRPCSRKAGERGVEPGGLDIQQLFAAAAQMQNQLMSAQQELADTEVQGTAGGGLVTVTISGEGELVDLVIAPAAIDAGDPQETAQTLADLVLAACRAAYGAIADLQEQMMGPLAAGLGGDSGSMPGLPGLPGFPGIPGLPGAIGPNAAGPNPAGPGANDLDDLDDPADQDRSTGLDGH
jgi:DNA-binding YbaB/EbfC family protein